MERVFWPSCCFGLDRSGSYPRSDMEFRGVNNDRQPLWEYTPDELKI